MPVSPDILRVVESSMDPTAIVDPELRVLAFNRPYLELVGMRPRELSGGQGRALCHERLGLETCAGEGCVARRAMQTGRPVRMLQVRSGNSELVLVVGAVPFTDATGAVTGAVETYRDVTAETRMQERFKRLLHLEREQKDVLQKEVERRSHELAAARMHLVQMEKLSSLGLLVAGIAHELNNPINFIYGNLSFVEEHTAALLELTALVDGFDLAPRDRARLEEAKARLDLDFIREDMGKLTGAIRHGAQRVAGIVSDLRTFSHGGNGSTPSACDLNETVSLTLNLVASEAKKRDVRIVRELGVLPPVICVASQMSQVVMNLAINAIQAVPRHGNVTVRTAPEGESAVVLEVQDDGPGISEENLSRIFDPFFTTKEVGEGTGLGLSISLGIVRAHGGDITARSEPGRGATLRVRLPLTPPVRG